MNIRNKLLSMRTYRLVQIAIHCIMLACVQTQSIDIDLECTSCASGTYSDVLAAITCIPCAANSSSGIESASCSCNVGLVQFGTGSGLQCVNPVLPDVKIVYSEVFIDRSIDFTTSIVKSVIERIANDSNTVTQVELVEDAISDTHIFHIRLLLAKNKTVALRLTDIYSLLLQRYSGSDPALIIVVDGMTSLRTILPQLSLGDRMFTYQTSMRTMNPFIFTKITQTTNITKYHALSPKNVQVTNVTSVFVVRSECTNLSCQCQPSPQNCCDDSLRTLTSRP